jgi:hypothetical protein
MDQGQLTVAVRQTAHPVARELCEKLQAPLVATSANFAGATGEEANPQSLENVAPNCCTWWMLCWMVAQLAACLPPSSIAAAMHRASCGRALCVCNSDRLLCFRTNEYSRMH